MIHFEPRFLPADALWNLALAINVYLTLFRKYNSQQLKSMEWKYHVMCYGCPFVVAFAYIFIQSSARGRIYGPAILWCWIDIDWVVLRIALCYAPAWLAIATSFCIYVLAGREIFAKRRQLRTFKHQPNQIGPVENPFTGLKVTEVKITHEFLGPQGSQHSQAHLSRDSLSQQRAGAVSPTLNGYDQYSVSIRSPPQTLVSPFRRIDLPTAASKNTAQHRANRAALEANAAAWGYTKVSLLFFVSLLVTWVSLSYFLAVRSLGFGESLILTLNGAGSILGQPSVFSDPP